MPRLAPAMLLNAKPDGHTLACMSINSLRYPHYQQTNWDPLKDFTYISGLSSYTMGIVVRSDSPWMTFEDMVAAAKKDPEKYNYGTSGAGGTGQLMMIEVEQKTGARFTTSYTRVGGQLRDMPAGFEQAVRKFLTECEATIEEVSKLLDKNKIYRDRMCDIGIISKEAAIAWGLTGPNLRASGVPRDLRKDRPYLGYEKYDFDVIVADEGDCYARYQVRMEEIRQSIKMNTPIRN